MSLSLLSHQCHTFLPSLSLKFNASSPSLTVTFLSLTAAQNIPLYHLIIFFQYGVLDSRKLASSQSMPILSQLLASSFMIVEIFLRSYPMHPEFTNQLISTWWSSCKKVLRYGVPITYQFLCYGVLTAWMQVSHTIVVSGLFYFLFYGGFNVWISIFFWMCMVSEFRYCLCLFF